jgi:hypothetical protein
MPSLLPFIISLTLEWDALRNNLRFQKFSESNRIPVKLFNPVKDVAARGFTPFNAASSVSDAEFLLPSLFRFCSQSESTGQGIEDFRVPERPGIINRHSPEAPLIAIAHQVAIVAIHQ